MVMLIREDDVQRVLTMPDAIAALDIAFRAWGDGAASNVSRQRVLVREHQGMLHVLPAAVPALDALGFKAYTGFPEGVRFAVSLFSASTGALKAIIEADWLGRMRTGAATGLATHYLARANATTVGVLGTGSQAVTQLMAVAAAREISLARVWGRDAERRETFGATMTEQLGFPVEPVETAEEAVRGADIVVTITSARDPVLHGGWIKPGVHINAAGSNWHNRRELDDDAILRADLIVADSVDQAHYEAGDLIIPASQGKLMWNRVRELHAVITGKTPGRLNDRAVTIFKSLGIGLEDIAVASRVYTLVCEQGLGQEVDFLS
jgi:alanine dehydrogenase